MPAWLLRHENLFSSQGLEFQTAWGSGDTWTVSGGMLDQYSPAWIRPNVAWSMLANYVNPATIATGAFMVEVKFWYTRPSPTMDKDMGAVLCVNTGEAVHWTFGHFSAHVASGFYWAGGDTTNPSQAAYRRDNGAGGGGTNIVWRAVSGIAQPFYVRVFYNRRPGAVPILVGSSTIAQYWTAATHSADGVTWVKTATENRTTWSPAYMQAIAFGVTVGAGSTNAAGHVYFDHIRLYEYGSLAPIIGNQSPEGGAQEERLVSTIEFDLTDPLDTGSIVEASTDVWVNGTRIYNNSVCWPGWSVTVTAIPYGYHYSFTRSSPLAGHTTVRVYGVDGDGLAVDETWEFDDMSEQLQRVLLDLYPPGAFTEVDDGCHWDLVRADADALAYVTDAIDQLVLELFPQTADETIGDWEAFLGIDTVAGMATATRLERIVAAARAAQACTPANIRSQLVELLQPYTAFWDPCDDEKVSYRLEQIPGNGTVDEVAVNGLVVQLAGLAHGEWTATTWEAPTVLLPPLVDRQDNFVFAVRVHAYTTDPYSGAGIVLFENETDCYLFGPWNTGAGTLLRLFKIEDGGTRTQLASVACPSPEFVLRAGRVGGEFAFYYGAYVSDPLTDTCTLLWSETSTIVPRKVGVFVANDSPWNSAYICVFDLKLHYEKQENNIEWIEPLASHVPSTKQDNIFIAFAHREPSDPGDYRIAEAQRLLNRVKWGHCLFLVGESDNFLTNDEHSLTNRDVLGGVAHGMAL